MAVQDEALEKLACCALAIQYIICSTVGWSIASIYDLSAHTYLGASVVYIGYGPPYRTIYILHKYVCLHLQYNFFYMSVCACIAQDHAHLTQVLLRQPFCIWNTGCCSAHHFEESTALKSRLFARYGQQRQFS